jgi:hypothetical protein
VIVVSTDVSEEYIAPIVILIKLIFLRSVLQLSVTANVRTSLILSTLKMEATRSSETSFRTRSTRRCIPEDGVLHSHDCENLKSYRL